LVINRFSGIGIILCGARDSVQGCYIGTDLSGTVALGNGGDGVLVTGDNNSVGAPSGGGNVISGNGENGVEISGWSNQVQNNLIGTDASGARGLGNGRIGVVVWSNNNLIGGSWFHQQRNVISANGGAGVCIDDSGYNQIQGNLIGTDVTGQQPLGNLGDGVDIIGGQNNLIGGGRYTLPGSPSFWYGNVIAANGGAGVAIGDLLVSLGLVHAAYASAGNQVEGNWIGTDASGARHLGNHYVGVRLVSWGSSDYAVTGNQIGGLGSLGNSIAFNAGDGVLVYGPATYGNPIRGNSIYGNSGLGIELVGAAGPAAAPILLAAVSSSTTGVTSPM
jgi:hypothetical protein